MPFVIRTRFTPRLMKLLETQSNAEVIGVLIKVYTKLMNLLDDTRSGLLHYAVRYKNFEIVKFLVDAGCRYDAFNADDNTPLMLAFMYNEIIAVKLLIEGVTINFEDRHFDRLLDIMTGRCWKDLRIIDLIFRRVDCGNATDEAIIKKLRNIGCPLYFIIYLKRIEVVRSLIVDHGFSVNAVGDGDAPMHAAVRIGSIEMVKLLVEHGAEVDPKNKIWSPVKTCRRRDLV